ncbi:MAG: mismatch repair protein MutT [Marmoricola sp.]|nr:mismatch repair protein MutT [Marmoricola sp.]
MAPTDPRPAPGPEIVAAGAVVVRPGSGGEVLLVHRQKYDDWSWPKGKQDPGEHVSATAVREVLEETGVAIRLGRPLPSQRYLVTSGRPKVVHYWTGRAIGDDDVSRYAVNDEIDRVGWFSLTDARRTLTYADDVDLLDLAEEHPRRTSALVVLRHARARKRGTWNGTDAERPLTDVGREQARSLIPVLAAYGVTRILSSDSVRCLRTVAPFARAHSLAVAAAPGLNEDDSNSRSIAQAVEQLLARKESAVLCSHRPVLPQVLTDLGVDERPLAPGELLVCHHRKGRVVATERHLVR